MICRRADIFCVVYRVLNITGFWIFQNYWAKKLPFPPKPTICYPFPGSFVEEKTWSFRHCKISSTSQVP